MYIYKILIETGNINYFTHKNDIRNLVSLNFDSKTFNEELDNCIWNTLLKSCMVTYNKYGSEQVYMAINRLFINNDYSNFTREENARNNLVQNITPDYLRKIAIKKCMENGLGYNINSIYNIIINEANISFNIKEQFNKK